MQPDADVEALGTILSVWAHPDDETYLAGGVMAMARDHGQRVVCASASAGEHGTSDPDSWPPRRLAAVRRWEATAALAVLGIDEHEMLGLPDGGLAAHDVEGESWVGELIDAVEPDTILTFGPDGMTFHADHVAVHRWATAAWRARGCRSRLLYATKCDEHMRDFEALYDRLGVYMTDERPDGTAACDLSLRFCLTGSALDRKVTALRAMATQTADVVAAVGPTTYAELVAEECFVDAPRPPRP